MESIRNSMNPRAKEKHEDSKKERKARTTSHNIKNKKLPAWYELNKSNQVEELEVVMKNGV